MRIFLILICIAVCINGCHNKNAVPAGILEKKQMQEVLWDIIQADAFTGVFIKKDTSKNPVIEDAKLQEQIFVINHISREDFYKSYNYYKEHPAIMLVVIDSINAGQRREDSIKLKVTTTRQTFVADSIKQKMIANKNIQQKPSIDNPPAKVDDLKTKAKKNKRKSNKAKSNIPAIH